MIASQGFFSLNEVDAALWDAVVDSPLMSHSYLCALEAVEDIPKYYVLFREEDKVVACAYFAVINTSLDKLLRSKGILSYLYALFRGRVLVCAGIAGEMKEPVWDALCSELEVMRKYYKASMSTVKGMKAKDLPLKGYAAVSRRDDAELEIHWETFSAYMRHFKSHYRAALRRDLDKTREVSVEVTHYFEHYIDEMALIAQQDKAYFEAMSGVASALVALFRYKGEIVGFVLFLKGKRSLYPLTVSVDRHVNEKLPLTLHSYYAMIKVAIEKRCDTLHLGEGGYAERMGARLVPLYTYLRTPLRMLTKILGWLGRKQ